MGSVRFQGLPLVSLALLVVLTIMSGCGDSGGESKVAGSTPPPGSSGKDIAEAYKKAYGPSGMPGPPKGSANTKH